MEPLVLFVLTLLLPVVTSVPVSQTANVTTPAPEPVCVEECDQEKVECGMECRAEDGGTREGFMECSKKCQTEYDACMTECREDAVELAEEAKQAAEEEAKEQKTAEGSESSATGSEAGKTESGATLTDAGSAKQSTGEGSATGAGGKGGSESASGSSGSETGSAKQQTGEKRDVVLDSLANVGSAGAGVLSSAMGDAVNKGNVAVVNTADKTGGGAGGGQGGENKENAETGGNNETTDTDADKAKENGGEEPDIYDELYDIGNDYEYEDPGDGDDDSEESEESEESDESD